MITLFIDTSLSDVSIALIKNNRILSSIIENTPNEHSIYTTYYIEKILKENNVLPKDIDLIMVVNGPGSFTGIRIGVTIAKVFAYLENIKIICISSLKSMALSYKGSYILSLIDAHHNNYYMGLYDKEYNEVIKEGFYKKEDLIKVINKYNPNIVSKDNIDIDNKTVNNIELNILNIYNYYKDKERINPHLVNPNYLKLPQALEELK